MIKLIFFQFLLLTSLNACKAEERKVPLFYTIKCPTELVKGTKLPDNTQVYGNLPERIFPLRSAGINLGNSVDPKERVFSEEILEDWVSTPDSTYLVSQYGASHEILSLKCNYAATGANASDSDPKSIVLLIPLPQDKPLKCTFVRKNGWKAAYCLVNQQNKP